MLVADTHYLWDTWEDADAGNGPQWVAFMDEPWEDPDERTIHMISPANDKPDGLYGWYDDVNPSFVFHRCCLPTVLNMHPESALEWLRSMCTPSNLRSGCPFYATHAVGDDTYHIEGA